MNLINYNLLNNIELSFNEVFIFSINFNNWQNNIDDFWQYLSLREKQHANKFHEQSLGRKYIISHGILRYILRYYIDVDPKEIQFSYNNYGKPFVSNNITDICFNMSHSHDMACYIIAYGQEVGIDLEYRNLQINIKELYDLVLTPLERKFIESIVDEERYNFFLTCGQEKKL